MSFLDKLKSGFDKAQHEINEFAETTKIKMEISKLQSRKTELFGQIGQQVYALHAKGQAPADVQAPCEEIDGLEEQIKAKQEQIAKLAADPAPAPAPPAAPEPPKPSPEPPKPA
jgi:translation initiation factor IF-3